jgi:16S rRNA (guanine966-N2)-methyltransferase
MRITGGRFKGRRLVTQPGTKARPTADKVKQAIFNILMHDIEGASVLDLFAGSGALGFEALSRGAEKAVFVEAAAGQIKAILNNLNTLGLEADVMECECKAACRELSFLKSSFDLIFADPPYHKIAPLDVIELVAQYNLLSPQGLLILEHKAGQTLDNDRLKLLKRRRFGQTEISFFTLKKETDE